MEEMLSRADPVRLLVVDDCPDTVQSLSRLLELWGFDALAAGDGASALELAGLHRPGVVLLDLALPGMDGLEFVRRLREEDARPRPLVVCMSGLGDEDVRHRCLEAGCDLHLAKPTDPQALRRLLERLARTFGEVRHRSGAEAMGGS